MPKTISSLMTLAVLLLVTGCGSGSSSSGGASNASGRPSTGESAAALSADAKSAATGDIPDTQNFLTLNAGRVGVAMLYPEGWTVQEGRSGVSISDKNNLVRIELSRGTPPTPASVQAAVAALARSTPGLKAGNARPLTLHSGHAVKVTYTTRSAPNPVTGRRVTLTVDRYVLSRGGRVATVDLGTPVGVDNVDAYKRMIESFKWR